MAKIIFIEMSELDYRLILHIKSLREKAGYSQRDLSEKMGLSRGFVGKVELFSEANKYSIRHLKLLADIFKCNSIGELFPFKIPKNDWIRITLNITPQIKKNGTPSKLNNIVVNQIDEIKKKL